MGLEEVLGRAGIEAKGERLAYLVMHAELERVLVSGPMRGKETTYALMSERVPCFPERSMEEGLGELVMRYFAGHGPATVHDCAWWSGLTLKEVKRGIAVAGEGIEVRGAWIAASERVPLPSEPRRVQLIPNFDAYVIGYEDRSALFQAPIEALGPPDRVLAAHLVLLDGVPVGSWRRTLDAKRAKEDLRLGRDVPEEAMAEALAAFERFVALPLETRRVP